MTPRRSSSGGNTRWARPMRATRPPARACVTGSKSLLHQRDTGGDPAGGHRLPPCDWGKTPKGKSNRRKGTVCHYRCEALTRMRRGVGYCVARCEICGLVQTRLLREPLSDGLAGGTTIDPGAASLLCAAPREPDLLRAPRGRRSRDCGCRPKPFAGRER